MPTAGSEHHHAGMATPSSRFAVREGGGVSDHKQHAASEHASVTLGPAEVNEPGLQGPGSFAFGPPSQDLAPCARRALSLDLRSRSRSLRAVASDGS